MDDSNSARHCLTFPNFTVLEASNLTIKQVQGTSWLISEGVDPKHLLPAALIQQKLFIFSQNRTKAHDMTSKQ